MVAVFKTVGKKEERNDTSTIVLQQILSGRLLLVRVKM